MIGRRAFLGTVALAVLTAPRLGEAWPEIPARVPRVGILGETNPIPWMVKTPAVDIECRWADAQRERLPELASQLIALDVDAIVALGAPSAFAASRSTTRIPIVVIANGDADERAAVARLARSVRNITWLGVTSEAAMAQQRLTMLSRLVPRLRRVAVLFNPDTVDNVRTVARLPGNLISLPAQSIEDVERLVLAHARPAVDGLIVLADMLFTVHAARLVELTAEAGLPTAYAARMFVEAGGLMAIYGDTGELIRRTATIVGRVLSGATPATLSPSPPSRPQIALNTSTAKRLGLAVTPSRLARADALTLL